MATPRAERRERRHRERPASFDTDQIYEEILRRDQQRIKSGLQQFESAAEAQKAASALEAGKIASARGLGGTGFAETIRGALTSGTAEKLANQEAAERARILRELQGPERLAPLHEASQKALDVISDEIREQVELGQAGSTTAGIVGSGASAVGSVMAGTQIPVVSQIGGALQVGGALTSGIGSGVGSAVSAAANTPERRRRARDIRSETAHFRAPDLGYADVLGAGPGYGSFETEFLGGPQAQRRPRTVGLFEDDLSSAYNDPYYG